MPWRVVVIAGQLVVDRLPEELAVGLAEAHQDALVALDRRVAWRTLLVPTKIRPPATTGPPKALVPSLRRPLDVFLLALLDAPRSRGCRSRRVGQVAMRRCRRTSARNVLAPPGRSAPAPRTASASTSRQKQPGTSARLREPGDQPRIPSILPWPAAWQLRPLTPQADDNMRISLTDRPELAGILRHHVQDAVGRHRRRPNSCHPCSTCPTIFFFLPCLKTSISPFSLPM